MREYRKKLRNIGQDGTKEISESLPLSGMLLCPYCRKTLPRRQVYKKKINGCAVPTLKKERKPAGASALMMPPLQA